MMLSSIQILSKGVFLSTLVIACTLVNPAQISSEQFRKTLVDNAAFEADDFTALDNGETVVKLLRVKDKKQVAVCGIVRLQNLPEISMTVFRDSLTQKNNESILDGGKFSTPPVFEDLQAVKLEARDIENMKNCAVGDCDLKMSASMIKRLQAEMDWNAPDYAAQATQLFRQMLFDYIRDYSERGNQALIQYDNRKNTVRLADEHRLLLNESLFIKDLAPEFTKYLRNFPRFQLPGVENSLNWSKVNFGLKPIITITHTATYAHRNDNSSQFLIATKQIYATRYIDSSLALALFVSITVNNSAETYLVFTDLSRSDALGGAFSGIKRNVVGQEALDRVKELLQRAKMRMEANVSNRGEPNPVSDEGGILQNIQEQVRNPVVQVPLLLLLGMILFFLYRKWRR